jgi:uncharacterized protein
MTNLVGGKNQDEISSIDLFLTEECNMNCSYCFHPKKAEKLTEEQGKAILDRLHVLSPKKMSFTFFGGEPMLYPDLMFYLCDYAVALWGRENVWFNISTNGTIFTPEIAQKMVDYRFSLQISCDGDEETTKECRGGNWELVINNIVNYLQYMPNLSIRMTYTAKTVGKLMMNVEFLHKLGCKRFMHHAVMEDDWTEEAVEKYRHQLTQLYNYRRYCFRNDIPLEIAFIDKPLKVLNAEVPQEKNFCEAGKSYMAIMPNGDVYPCHRASSNRIFKLGNLFEKRPFIRGVFASINKEYTGCSKNCFASNTCHSCPITHFKVNGELTTPIWKYCGICKVENQLATQYIPTEVSDKRDKKLDKLAMVVADMAEQMAELKASGEQK